MRKTAILSLVWIALTLVVLATAGIREQLPDRQASQPALAVQAAPACTGTIRRTSSVPEASLIGMTPLNVRGPKSSGAEKGCASRPQSPR